MGTVFIGTNMGLFEYNGSLMEQITYPNETKDSESTLVSTIECSLFDEEGSLWLGTFGNGLIKISKGSFHSYRVNHYKITDKRILALAQSPEGHLLVGSENDGLFVLEKNGDIIKNYRHNKADNNSIKSNSIWSVFVDKEQRIWIGTYNKGVGVYDRFYDKFKDLESIPNQTNSLQSSAVNAIVKDKNNRLWLGLDGGGIDVYDLNSQNIVHLSDPGNKIAKGLTSLDVIALFFDSGDNLWVGTWAYGIFYLPKNKSSFIEYNVNNTSGGLSSNRVMSFAEDERGIIWIGTFLEGLHSFDPKTKKFNKEQNHIFGESTLDQRYIRKVFIASDQSIWLGTSGGLFRAVLLANGDYRLLSLKEKMYKNLEQKVFMDVIVSIFEDSQKNIWIGAEGDGLFKYDPKSDSVVWYNSTNGLKHETIASIIEDDNGNIWLGGNKGISYLDISTDMFTNYDTKDGLLANDFNFNSVYKDVGGILYFGSYNGVNYMDPTTIPSNEYAVRPSFTDFRLFNKSVLPNSAKSPLQKSIAETSQITLTHRQSVFTVEYVGINFTRPEKNQYAYYLDGFEDTWNYVGNTRNATYTNLSPGEYTFKVKAANNDGIWNETPITLGITVLPPWWATKTALLSYLLLLILVVYVLATVLEKRLKERRLAKFERDRLRQEEALNENKIQFFTNISHEFRTPLTLILNPLEDILHNTTLLFPESVKEKHKIIHKNANRLKRLIDELMDFRKLELHKMPVTIFEIEVVGFVETIVDHFKEEATLKNIMLYRESDEEPLVIWSDPGKLEKIIFNILSNAFKGTPENGTITVGVYLNSVKMVFPLIDEEEPLPAVEISIEDTGIGIKKEEISNIFGRFYQAKNNNGQYIGGTGIGLEVVKRFVDLLKGLITVESKEGEGTRFRLFLPLGRNHFRPEEFFVSVTGETVSVNADPSGTENKEGALVAGSAPVESKTLLVVEDNTELRTYLKTELELDYNILEASNGTQGLALALQKIPDIIITDIIMPEMDGFEFCTRIRQELRTSHIPILMLTAKTMSEDWVRGIDAGADVYLAKPFEMKVLRAQLKQIIASRQILIKKLLKDSNTIKIPDNTSLLDKDFITKVLDYINEHLADEDLNVEHLADDLFLSRSQLYRKIKALTGHTANEFIRTVRIEKAKDLIEHSDVSIGEIGYKVGFSSPSYFTKCFKAYFGILPTEVKRVY